MEGRKADRWVERVHAMVSLCWFSCVVVGLLFQVFGPELGEHKLVYTDLHNQFKRLFEELKLSA